MTPEEAEIREKIFKESKKYVHPDCFVIGAGYGSAVFADLYRKDGIDKFKLVLREEIEKQRKEMRYEYAVRLYDSFLETIDSITPKK